MKLSLKPSSHIVGAWYDPESRKLRVEYHHGGSHVYEGVPQDVATAFEDAESHGGFHNRHLKGHYPGTAG